MVLKFWKLILRKKSWTFLRFFRKWKIFTTNRKMFIEHFKIFNWKFSICREFFSFSKKSQKFPGFFFSKQFPKFQNQYFSMRFFLNLIYAFAVFQRAHFKPCSGTVSSRKRPVPKICTPMSELWDEFSGQTLKWVSELSEKLSYLWRFLEWLSDLNEKSVNYSRLFNIFIRKPPARRLNFLKTK